jgi:DNA-binding IclR family transcriptional regulator
MGTDSPQGAQLISKAAVVLRALPRGSVDGRRLSDLVQSTGMTLPTVRRILLGLMHEGFVVQDAQTRRYSLGPLIFELGLSSSYHARIVDRCRPHIRALADETGDSIFFAMRTGVETICLDRADGNFPIRASVAEVGERLMLGVGTGGVALLAAMPDHEIEEILSGSDYDNTGLSVEEIRERIAAVRKHGYADISDKPIPGVRGVGISVPSRVGPPTFSVSVVAVHMRLTDEHLQNILPALRKAASAIEGL